MTLPASNKDGNGVPQNSISFGQIETEFGQTASRGIGQYRTNRVYGAWDTANAGIFPRVRSDGLSFPLSTNAGLDANADIPTSGPIKWSDFYSGKRTVLIDAYSVNENASMLAFAAEGTRFQNYTMNARNAWNGGNRVRVGGEHISAQPSSDPENTRVIVYVNKILPGTLSKESMTYTRNEYVAFNTGVWPASTELHVLIGDQGKILGAGGQGGDGGDGDNDGSAGRDATSAVGCENDCTITIKNGGVVERGYGGGGGGGGYYETRKSFLIFGGGSDSGEGGGGGGGGGVSVNGATPGGSGANAGGVGVAPSASGGGGGGGDSDDNDLGGDGGDGGDSLGPPETGADGGKRGGASGANGNPFRKRASAINVNVNTESSAWVPDTAVTVGPVRLDT